MERQHLQPCRHRNLLHQKQYKVGSASSGKAQRIEIPEIPADAIREIVVNSFAHANYRGETEHEIDITPTEVEIYNPGSFPMNLNPESFVLKKRKSLPRNKNILETLYKCKDIEMFGSGFKKVYALCESKGIKVKYGLDPYGFSFFFLRNANGVSTEAVLSEEDGWMNDVDREILALIKERPALSSKDISDSLNRAQRTVQRSLSSLKERGKIRRIGTLRRGYWEIIR